MSGLYNYPKEVTVNVLQFDNTPQTFWISFKARNPNKSAIELNMSFDEKYGQCFDKALDGSCCGPQL